MGTTAAVIAVAGLVIGAVGAGVAAYGQHQQGKMQNAIAQMNAQQQERQASLQLKSMQTQAAMQKQQENANFALRAAEAKARFQNADAIAQNAVAQDAVNRLNLRKRREEFAAMQGTQRAAIAASGVSESTGTPLQLLVETTEKIQQDQEEQHYTNEVTRRTLLNESQQERLGGKLALAGATLDRDSGVLAATLRSTAARGEYLGALRGAEITRLTGSAAQKAGNYQAGATLLSQASSNAQVAKTINWKTS